VRQSKKNVLRFQIVGVALVLLLVAAMPVFAQLPTATILGVVKDASGGTVAGAAVTVTNADTGVARTGTTGDDGAYRFPALEVGNYQIEVKKDGFQTAQRKGLTLAVDQAVAIDFTLQVGSTGQTVTVTEEAPQVNTTDATVGGLVTEDNVADLPLNGRDLVDLTLLQAGISQSSLYSTLTVGVTNITGTVFSSNGGGIHSNNYLLDGAIQTGVMATNNSSIIGTTLGVDGVKEYKVVSSVPSAEYGLVMGSTSTIVSKGGTNQWHGDAFDYLRNSAMDARNFFDALDVANFYGYGTDKSSVFPGKRIPPFERNNFGVSGGGPIKKDKTFFYAVYEAVRQRWGQTIATNTLPGACFDQTVGDSTYHQVTAASFGSSGCSNVAPANQNPVVMHFFEDTIFPGQVGMFPYPDANICGTAGCTNNPAGNTPGTQLTGTTFNYSFPYIQPSDENYGQIRLDQNFSANDSLFARYTQDDANQIAQGGYQQVKIFQSSAAQFATLSENHIFSPTLLNTVRYSFQRTVGYDNYTLVPNITDPNVILVPTASTSSQTVFTSFGTGSGVTAFSATGGADGVLLQNIYSYSDDVFWTKGRNAFKFGANLNQIQAYENFIFNQGGNVAFSNLASTAIGNWDSITTEAGTQYPLEERRYLYSTLGFYGQDDVRASSRLSLNLGLRYEFATVPREANGNDWNIQNILTANGANATQGAVPSRMFINPSLLAFSPRIGFAYDPTGKGTMSIRGGGGIYYNIGNYGALIFEEACCEPPSDYFTISTNNLSTPPYAFAVPLPTAVGSPNSSEPGVAAALALPSPRNVDYHIKNPKMMQYNLTIDRQLPWDLALSAGYVGSRGYHLPVTTEDNPTLPLGYLPNGLPYFCNVAINPTSTDPSCAGSSNPASPYYLHRTNPTYGQMTLHTQDNYEFYNSLQANLTKRVSHGLQFGAAFTWAKMIDDGTSQQPGESETLNTQSPIQKFLDKGLSGFNVTENLRFNVIYHAPTVKSDKMYYKPLNGWWFSSIVSEQSGYPFTPSLGVIRSFTNDRSMVDRPNLGANYDPSTVIIGSPSQWFNPAMFAVQPDGTYGNSPRSALIGPGLRNVDFSAVKDTKARFLGEQGNVEFRYEVFNALNHPNFSAPNQTVWSPGSAGANGLGGPITATGGTFPAFSKAGQITSTANRSRQMQLALKVIF
jgi:hypothetical protein